MVGLNVTSSSSSVWTNNTTLSVCDPNALLGQSSQRYKPAKFENTITIERFHYTFPRFGHGRNITADLIQGSPSQQRNYLVGLLASSIAIFCFFVVWVIFLFVLKGLGPSRVGLFSGRRIRHVKPPKPPKKKKKQKARATIPSSSSPTPTNQPPEERPAESNHRKQQIFQDGNAPDKDEKRGEKEVIKVQVNGEIIHPSMASPTRTSKPFVSPTLVSKARLKKRIIEQARRKQYAKIQSTGDLGDLEDDEDEDEGAEVENNLDGNQTNSQSEPREVDFPPSPNSKSKNDPHIEPASPNGDGTKSTNSTVPMEESYPTGLQEENDDDDDYRQRLSRHQQEQLEEEEMQEQYRLTLEEWKTRVDRYENRLRRMRIGVLFAGICIIISAVLMVVEGVTAMEEALASATSGVLLLQNICNDALALIDKFVQSETTAQTNTQHLFTELNGTS